MPSLSVSERRYAVHRRIQRRSRRSGPPFFEYKKIHCNCMSTEDKGIAKKLHKVKIFTYYDVRSLYFSSSPTFTDTDLAQAIYMASRGSPKLFVALSVTSFIDSLHTVTAVMCTQHAHLVFDHVSPRENEHNMGIFGAHRRVGGFSLLLRFPLATMLTFCTIIKKRDHQKFLNFLPAVVIISLTCWSSLVKMTYF